MYCCSKLEHYTKLDLNIIISCIEHITKQRLSLAELSCFIDKISYHKQLYPTELIKNFETSYSLSVVLEDYLHKHGLICKNIKPDISHCCNCKNILIRSPMHSYEAIIYYVNKIPEKCFNSYISCSNCSTNHFYSYYINSSKQKFFYTNFAEKSLISFTNRTIYEKKLLDTVTSDLHFKHASFTSFVDSFNFLNSNATHNNTRHLLCRQRLVESWFYYQLLIFKSEYGELSTFIAPHIEHLDDELASIRNLLLPRFVKKWTGDLHSNNCKHPKCSKLLNVDGNWKITRLKCAFYDIFLKSPELKPIRTGCKLAPIQGGYYCKTHYQPEPVTSLYINNELKTYRIKSIVEANIMFNSRRIKTIHDVFNPTTEADNDDNLLYLVESIEQSIDNLYWLKKINIPNNVFNDFLKSLGEREEIEVYDQISCNTNKHFKTPFSNKGRTHGTLIAAFNCNIVIGYRELYGSESITQV